MARIVPNSEIHFYRNIEESRPVAFSSANARDGYFSSHEAGSIGGNNYTMIRKTSSRLRIEANAGIIKECNYLSFKNTAFDNKIFYAKIMDYEYINNECVEVLFAIDFWFTYMFDVTYEECMIDRQHLSEPDYQTSLQDPYGVAEFLTPEDLAVGADTEPFEYEYSTSGGGTGVFAFGAAYGHSNNNTTNVLFSANICPPPEQGTKPITSYGPTLDKPASECNEEETWFKEFFSSGVSGYKWSSDHVIHYSGGSGLVNTYALPLTIYFIDDDDNLGEFLDHIVLWGAVSGIAALFKIPAMYIAACMHSMSISAATATEIIPQSYSRKLCCYPFSYVRVETPGGDRKEYQYEKFRSGHRPSFRLSGSLNGVPRALCVPEAYGITPGAQQYTSNFNERITYSGFPQTPYVTDSFTAFLASAATDLMRSRTSTVIGHMTASAFENQELYSNQSALDMAGFALSSIESGTKRDWFGLGKGAVNEASQQLNRAYNSAYALEDIRHNAELMNNADALSLSNLENNPVYEEYRRTRSSFTTAEYHATSEGGYELFDSGNRGDFTITCVTLRQDILVKYDAYFKMYGYTKGEAGIPNICAFMHRGGSAQPHWDTIGGKKVTYVKTTGCAVNAPTKPVQDFFKALFDGGVQFINGDEL